MSDDSMLADRDQLARDLHAIADRIEDGEYKVTNIEIQKPSREERTGRFGLEFCTEAELARMRAVFDAQTPGGRDE